MPLPRPEGDEDEQAFVSRCISTLTKAGEFDSQEQRAAVCYSQWRREDSIDPPAGDGDLTVDRIDVYPLPKATKTDEGFLRAPATRVARVGVQSYRREDGTIQRELRLPEYVFDPKSLETLESKPVCRGHPTTRVDSSNARALAKGVVTNPRPEGDFLTADLTIHDGETIQAVESGERENSCGYRTRLVPIVGGVFRQPGHRFDGTEAEFLQTNIRHNHVAVLHRGRANVGLDDAPVGIRLDGEQDVFRLDGAGNQISGAAAPKQRERIDMMVKINGVDYDVPDAVAEHIEMLRRKASETEAKSDAAQKRASELEAKADSAQKRASEHEARADAAEQKISALEKDARAATEAARGAERFGLMKVAEGIVKRPIDEIVRMDDAELRRAILVAKCPKLKLDGKDDSYVAAYLDRELEAERASKNSATELRGSTQPRTRRDADEESPLLRLLADQQKRASGVKE